MLVSLTFASVTRRLGLLSLMLGAGIPLYAEITYSVNQTIGAGSVIGDIVTDGTIGTLNPSIDIVGWNLLLNEGPDGSFVLSSSSGNSTFQNQILGIGGYFSATPTQLLFDFSNGAGSYFQGGSPQFVWCLQAAADECAVGGAGEAISVYGLSLSGDTQFAPMSGTQVIATAGSSSVPEPSTFALLGAGLALLGFSAAAGWLT
jgi:hypothetical protein